MNEAVQKQRLQSSTMVLFGIWISMVLVIVSGLMLEDRFFAVSGKPVAFLKTAKSEVNFRTEDDIKWKLVQSKQGFFDGDRIATGLSGTAAVDFGEGRTVEVGQDSIIAISSIREATGNSFIINLVKGGIKPLIPASAKHALVVMSGTSTFVVEPGEERGFAKTVGGSLREFSAKEKFPVHSQQREPEPQRFVLPASYAAPAIGQVPSDEGGLALDLAPTPAPAVVATPIPKAVAKKPHATPIPKAIPIVPAAAPMIASASIVEKSVMPNYMTLGSFASVGSQAIKIAVKVQAGAKADEKAIVVAQSGAFSKVIDVENDGSANLIISSDLVRKGARSEDGAIPCINLTLVAGNARVGGAPSPNQQALSRKKVQTRVCSITDAKAKMPLVIGLTGLGAPVNDIGFYTMSSHVAAYPIEIAITRERDFSKFLPYLRSSNSFKIRSFKGLGSEGTFSVDAGKVTVQYLGPGMTPELLDKALQIFGHSFVFKGKRASVYDASHLDLDAFKAWITENTSKGHSVYIRTKSTLVPVSRDFMDERREVADFVKKASGTIFLEKVEVVAFR